MASLAKIFGGIVLVVAGIAIIYESSLRNLIEIVTILGVILVIMGAYLLILSFFERNSSNRLQNFKKNLDGDSKSKKLDNGIENKNNILNKGNDGKNTKNKDKKDNIATNLGNNLSSSKLNSLDAKKITNKVKDVSKNKDLKSVLKPITPKSNENTKKFRFTPNYEKPMKVNRRPQKRNKSNLNNIENVNNLNKKQERIGDNINNLNNNLDNNLYTDAGEKSERIARALTSDDFIKPIHTESKPILEPDTLDSNNLDSNELDLNTLKQNRISKNIKQNNNQNTNKNTNQNIDKTIPINKNINQIPPIEEDYSQDITTDDLENENISIDDISSHEVDSSDFGEPSKFLSSYVVCSKGTMTSKEAFDELAKSAKSEIFLEMASIKDMTNEFLSKISSLDVKIIIQEFDIKDMSYVLLITSLLEQGVEIRILPLINTINLIADDSHALIISENESSNNLDIGAVYNDSKSVSNVKSMFERSWDIANDLDINNVGKEFS